MEWTLVPGCLFCADLCTYTCVLLPVYAALPMIVPPNACLTDLTGDSSNGSLCACLSHLCVRVRMCRWHCY